MGRLRYLLSHGAKEGLVKSPFDWPGVHSARPLCDGTMRLEGSWLDETGLYEARRGSGRNPTREDHRVQEVVELTPLPCWRHLSAIAYRRSMSALVVEIEQESKGRSRRTGLTPDGGSSIREIDALSAPRKLKKSPAPPFHAATRVEFFRLRDAYLAFVASFYSAAEKLLAGDREVTFPSGSFPRALPFVEASPR